MPGVAYEFLWPQRTKKKKHSQPNILIYLFEHEQLYNLPLSLENIVSKNVCKIFPFFCLVCIQRSFGESEFVVVSF